MNKHLKAIESNGDYGVKDTEDGFSMWWPNEATQAEIRASEDPEALAVKICDEEPGRGEWSN